MWSSRLRKTTARLIPQVIQQIIDDKGKDGLTFLSKKKLHIVRQIEKLRCRTCGQKVRVQAKNSRVAKRHQNGRRQNGRRTRKMNGIRLPLCNMATKQPKPKNSVPILRVCSVRLKRIDDIMPENEVQFVDVAHPPLGQDQPENNEDPLLELSNVSNTDHSLSLNYSASQSDQVNIFVYERLLIKIYINT